MSIDSRRTSISEDWEELDAISGTDGIYDDTASILSLSTTLDGSEDSNSSHGASSTHQTTEIQESGGASSGRVATEPHDATEQDQVFSPLASASTSDLQDNDTDSIASADTITGDLLDIVVEPPILLSTLDTLQSTLSEIIPLCENHDSTDKCLSFPEVLRALHRLLGTIMDLKEVVSCYAKLWKPDDPFSRTPPLDPMLYKWSSNCALELYQLQAELEDEWSKSEGHADSLNKLCEDLDAFLPIMRVDLDEYQAPRLSFPTCERTSEPPSHHSFLHRRYRNTDPDEVVAGPIPALRRQLYALKDEIGKTNGIINDCKVTKVFSKAIYEKLSEITNIQTCTFRGLGVLLSNHGSDWIDQTIAGGLSYAEFTNLDPQTIQAFEMRFSSFGSLLDDLRWSLSYNHRVGDKLFPKRALSFSDQRCEKSRSEGIATTATASHVAEVFDAENFKAMIAELNALLKVKVE